MIAPVNQGVFFSSPMHGHHGCDHRANAVLTTNNNFSACVLP